MKEKWMALVLLIVVSGALSAQYSQETAAVMARLDSLRKCPSVSRHFAGIYFTTTEKALQFFSASDSATQQLVARLEKRFAGNFFIAVDAYAGKTAIPDVWQAYYKDENASDLRYILFGINAHINGDIWQALTAEFSLEEVKKIRHWYFLYYKGLLKDYSAVYEYAFNNNSKIRLLHSLSFGLDKLYGKIMLRRWRKRQMKLAELYYTDRPRFQKKLARLTLKMNRLNNLIRKCI